MVSPRAHRRPHAQRLLRQRHGPCRPRRRSGAPVSRGVSKPRARRNRPCRIPAPRRSPDPPPSFSLSCFPLRASHLPHAPRHLRKRFRIRLHPAPRLALALSRFPRCTVLIQPRPALLDSHSSFRHRRADSLPLARAACRRSVPCRHAGFLSFHRVLSRLGWHLVFRQPLFRFAHRAFHPWPRRFPQSRRATLPLLSRCSRRGFRIPRPLRFRERGPHVPVGFAPHPRARSRPVLGSDPQSVFRRPPPARRRSPHLSLQAQSPHAADRRPRPPPARAKSPFTLSVAEGASPPAIGRPLFFSLFSVSLCPAALNSFFLLPSSFDFQLLTFDPRPFPSFL